MDSISRDRLQLLLGWLRDFWLDLLALLWPTACVACGWPDRDLCSSCTAAVCEARGAHTEYLSAGPPYYVAGPYSGEVRATLIAFKHDGAYGCVKPLGIRLGSVLRAACAEAGTDPPLLVTIPSRPARVRSRGYRHVDALVGVAVRRERLPLELVRVLRVTRGRTGQVGLGAASRERNARRIAVRKRAIKFKGREVILVDDIVTTGATTRAACEVLELAGMRVIAVVALCHAVRKDDSEQTQVEEQGQNAIVFRKGVKVRHTGPPASSPGRSSWTSTSTVGMSE